MKTKFTYTLLAAAAVCSWANAQSTAYTAPVGYTTQTLAANSFNLVGINLLTPVAARGTLTNVASATLTDSTADYSTALTAGKTYILEVTSGTAAGTVQEFVSWSGSTLTLPAAVAGLAAGDAYTVRAAATLQEVFPVGFLAGSGLATNADKVWVPTGAGTYTKYWYKTTSPVGWHTTTTGQNNTGAAPSSVPLVYIDGILIEKKGTAKDLVMTGEVKTTGSNALVAQGFNLISINPPSGSTLTNSGLVGDIAGSGLPTNADIVWVPAGNGTYTGYWYKSTNPAGWCTTTTGSNNAGAVTTDVALTPGVFIQRKSATPKVITLDVPSSYSSL